MNILARNRNTQCVSITVNTQASAQFVLGMRFNEVKLANSYETEWY